MFLNRQINYLYYNSDLTYRAKIDKTRTMLSNRHVQSVINDTAIISKGPRRKMFDFIARWLPAPILLLYIWCLRGNAY